MFKDLENKKVLITGSTSGIGLEIANAFSKAKCLVALNGRNKRKLHNAKKKIFNSLVSPGNVENPKSAKKVVSNAFKKLKGLDILVCNVGSGQSAKPGKEKYLDWQKSFKKNLFSATNVIEESKKYLIKSKGVIICISSICGTEFIKGAPITYSTAKSALNTYVKLNSKILGNFGVRINAIAPGNIMLKGSTWEKKLRKNRIQTKNLISQNVPLNKFGLPKNISDICIFLASKNSGFVTGSIWVVDGGQTKRIDKF